MINLLEETLTALEAIGRAPEDVKFIASFYVKTDWKHFALNANFDYDNDFGTQIINNGLMIVGDNWWLERSEYDGAEGWDFKEIPKGDFLRIAKPHEVMDMIR